MSTLGEKLSAARRKAGLSMDRLASLAGTSKDMIWKIESGQTKNPYKLPQIAAALGIKADDLADDPIEISDPGKWTEDLERLIESLEQQDDEESFKTAHGIEEAYPTEKLRSLANLITVAHEGRKYAFANSLGTETLIELIMLLSEDAMEEFVIDLGPVTLAAMVKLLPKSELKEFRELLDSPGVTPDALPNAQRDRWADVALEDIDTVWRKRWSEMRTHFVKALKKTVERRRQNPSLNKPVDLPLHDVEYEVTRSKTPGETIKFPAFSDISKDPAARAAKSLDRRNAQPERTVGTDPDDPHGEKKKKKR